MYIADDEGRLARVIPTLDYSLRVLLSKEEYQEYQKYRSTFGRVEARTHTELASVLCSRMTTAGCTKYNWFIQAWTDVVYDIVNAMDDECKLIKWLH